MVFAVAKARRTAITDAITIRGRHVCSTVRVSTSRRVARGSDKACLPSALLADAGRQSVSQWSLS